MNHLAGQTSPYLAMHAEDPVEWRPWGPEAFEVAAYENKPVFLSVGYASCHWCHVMQRESFRDPETADYLNDHFVSVKVDREERPDVDALYMDYVTATTGSGGWPMSVFTTPEQLPILGGTYFPKTGNEHIPGFMDVLAEVSLAFTRAPDEVADTAGQARAFLEEQAGPRVAQPVTERLVETAAEVALRGVDREHGGFGGAPKFPQAPLLGFLMAFQRASGDPELAYQTRRALEAMVRGGIYDQAAGGIFRYAVDAVWLVPHFEKMLYDNALLLGNLADAYELEPTDELAYVMRQTAGFLDASMASPGGGYVAALSAETLGVEGATYVWLYDELAEILSPEELGLAELRLGVTREGSFHRQNILTRRDGRTDDAEAVDAVLAKLLAERDARPQPAIDTKVIVSWNAMAAAGLMRAGAAMGDERLTGRGHDLARTLLDRAVDGDEVVHVLDDPSVAHVRLLEDYAHVVAALIEAAGAADVGDALEAARALHAASIARFAADGLLYMTADDTDLPVRPREQHDNPTPSGASQTVLNAVRLHALTGDDSYRELAAAVLPQFWGIADHAPSFAGTALVAMIEYLEGQ